MTGPPHDTLRFGGGRFTLWREPGPPPVVVKRGDPFALANEAAALRDLAGLPGVAPLVRHEPGVLVTADVGGSPREASALDDADLTALAAVLATVHRPDPRDSVALCRAYVDDRVDGIARGPWGDVLRDVAAPLPAPRLRRIHGDLTLGNILWRPEPALVDWEYSRMGDPAEDLAYAMVVNELSSEQGATLVAAYPDRAAAVRARYWIPFLAVESAAWWLAHGRPAAAAALLRRAGLRRSSAPSARTPRVGGGPPA